ncbi:MAG: radical SAM protein [Gemmatales bacterium]|nr:B12-binding domain-containing radical SAM protein [Gemmatales bacterium]MDW8174146.1 radical SAM protein [Gemmatales bacterium]
MVEKRRKIVLVQLPIPPMSGQTVRGNVALAAGYLALYARRCGLHRWFDVEILPSREANSFGDCALVDAILARRPWMVGFTCYLWNVERSLWLAEQLKHRLPELRILVGGPEITLDNAWVLAHAAVDYAVVGEGEATFVELLRSLAQHEELPASVPGLIDLRQRDRWSTSSFLPRTPLPSLDLVASPYLEGILDAAEEKTLLLETLRGCVFKCKFCYYPKNYDKLYFLSSEKLRSILQYARQAGVREIVLLDPTLNQRRDLIELLRLLAEMNPEGQWTCFGELRAEGINEELAQWLRRANFTEVEVGLQSIEPRAMRLMDRKNHLGAFERGVTALRRAGIRVKVDLIIGLPGDTPESVRASMDYLRRSGLYDDVQVFHLMVLPGTDFRREAQQLGLRYQARPPYYVTQTPDLTLADMFTLQGEASAVFDLEWDELPDLTLPRDLLATRPKDACIQTSFGQPCDWVFVAFPQGASGPVPVHLAQTCVLWFYAQDFRREVSAICTWLRQVFRANPFISLTLVLEAPGGPATLPFNVLQQIWRTCLEQPTYLDRYFSVQAGRARGAKRLVVCLPEEVAPGRDYWRNSVEEFADLIFISRKPQASPESLPCPC